MINYLVYFEKNEIETQNYKTVRYLTLCYFNYSKVK